MNEDNRKVDRRKDNILQFLKGLLHYEHYGKCGSDTAILELDQESV